MLRRQGLGLGIVLGGAIFAVILGAFFLCRPFLDLEAIAAVAAELTQQLRKTIPDPHQRGKAIRERLGELFGGFTQS